MLVANCSCSSQSVFGCFFSLSPFFAPARVCMQVHAFMKERQRKSAREEQQQQQQAVRER